MNSLFRSKSSGLCAFAFSHTKRRAFTLLEILIVAMLISLFSGLAIFGMQYLRETSMRKAAIADARTLGSAISMFQIDLNTIPKLGYLSCPVAELHRLAALDGLSATALPTAFDSLGYYSDGFLGTYTGSLSAGRAKILADWAGPYLPNPRQRKMVASTASVGYYTRMAMPNKDAGGALVMTATTPADYKAKAGSNIILDWPADPWGNPYVLYLVHLDTAADASPWWIASPSQSANYVAYVVSYAKNGFPGGDSTIAEQGGTTDNDPLKISALPYRLYLTADDSMRSQYDFVALLPPTAQNVTTAGTYNLNRLQALHRQDYTDPKTSVRSGWRTVVPSTNPAYNWSYLDNAVPGVLDPGSDDIIYQIP
jgi:prepilin-type N-terminal cleavage/methylation domain-containing protein